MGPRTGSTFIPILFQMVPATSTFFLLRICTGPHLNNTRTWRRFTDLTVHIETSCGLKAAQRIQYSFSIDRILESAVLRTIFLMILAAYKSGTRLLADLRVHECGWYSRTDRLILNFNTGIHIRHVICMYVTSLGCYSYCVIKSHFRYNCMCF